MKKLQSTDDVYNSICNASLLGTLGFFVGSGFTKAILHNGTYKAYSWGELLNKCCEILEIDPQIMSSFGSYPEIATKICKQYSSNKGLSYKAALRRLKETICALTTVAPDSQAQTEYEELFEKVNPSWIATTNYDTILESILNGRAFSIEPTGCFTKIKGLVPIYHIHGICKNPDSVVITNEDYAYLFRPNEYRQARLPFLMKESLVLMMGYGLGDINVLTAVDWSNNVYTNTNEEYDFPIIQLLYTENPKDGPYQDESGITILEIKDLHEFFVDLCKHIDKTKTSNDEKIERINKYISQFTEASEGNIDRFINNESFYRTNINKFLASLTREFGYIYTSYLSFLRRVISKLNDLALPNGAFSAYDKKLNIILDTFENMPVSTTPTTYFHMLAREFDSVAYYVGKELGKSWKAADTWERRKKTIPQPVIKELWRIVSLEKSNYINSARLLEELVE